MAKIKFENGVTVNFNGNPTPQDIEEVAQKLGISKKKDSFIQDVKQSFNTRTNELATGYQRQIEGKQTLGESVIQTLGQGAGMIGDVAFSGASRLAGAVTPDFIEKPVVEAGKKLLTKVVSTPLVSGAVSGYQKFAENQPRAAANIESITNIASLLPMGKAGQVAGKITGETLLKSGKMVGKAGEVISAKTAGAAKFGISQASGLNRETIEQIIKNPQAFTKATIDNLSRESFGKQVKQGIVNRINELKSVGAAYEPLRKSTQVVNVPIETYIKPLEKYGLELGANGKLLATAESRPFNVSELGQIENFIKQYGSVSHTPNSALNARESLSSIAKYDMTKSNNLTSLAKDMRVSLNNVIRNDKVGIQGLKQLDDIYSAETRVLKDIKKDYFVKGTNDFKDNALSKIANLTKEGRQSVLARLKQIDPNIESKVNILRAIEDIKASGGLKVGTYARGAIGAGGVLTGNIPLLLTAIASQPEILVPILRAWGKIRLTQKGFVSGIENKLKKGIDLVTNEKSFINQAIDDYSKKMIEKVKNIKPGLSIEDVSLKGKGEILKSTPLKLNPTNFKTAEDYVKAQGTPVYHGTNATFDKFDVNKGDSGFGNVGFFTTDKELATGYGKNTVEAYLNFKNPKLITSSDEWSKIVYHPETLQKQGFDGVIGNWKTEAGSPVNLQMALDNSQIKTKSQLISEWNKAQPLKSLEQEAKKYKSVDEFIKNKYKGENPNTTYLDINIKRLKESGINVKSPNDIITIYHGTNKKGLTGISGTGFNEGSFFATDKNAAKKFVGRDGDVMEVKVPVKDLGIVKEESMAGTQGNIIQNFVRLNKDNNGIYRANLSDFKTKEELKSIWKQSQKLK